jgi:alpha-galactosidase
MNSNLLLQSTRATFKGLLLAGLASSHLLATASAAETPAENRTYLTPEMAESVENFGEVKENLSFTGEPISIGGQTFDYGLGVHANSCIVFPLDESYATFHVVPGPDDSHHGKLEMKILVDDTQVWSSGEVSSARVTPEPLDFPVAGAKTLTLIVEDCGEPGGDHASWGDAYLMPATAP